MNCDGFFGFVFKTNIIVTCAEICIKGDRELYN